MSDPLEVKVYKPNPSRKPHLEGVRSVVLKPGPHVRRQATLYAIRDPKTGEHHHDALSIETFAKGQVVPDEKRSLTLGEGEVDRLADFLVANRTGATAVESGNFLLLPAHSQAADFVRRMESLDTKADALAILLQETAARPELIRKVVSRLADDDGYLAKTVAAMNLEVYRRVIAELEELIDDPTAVEGDFQKLLEKNPWAFGSEYSCLLDRRRLTRDEIADFVPRRTTDGRVELIEIKTPLRGKALFNPDPSHDNLYPGAELSKVVAQAEKYLEKLDRDRNRILVDDGIDVTKACVKIIIGRDGDEAQQAALHRHNGHLHRIEILTFDGLLQIARRVTSYLQDPHCELDHVPF